MAAPAAAVGRRADNTPTHSVCEQQSSMHGSCTARAHPSLAYAALPPPSSSKTCDCCFAVLCRAVQSGIEDAPEGDVNYLTAAAGPSVTYAPRKFCSVCGFNSA